MSYRWAALMVLALFALTPEQAAGQQAGARSGNPAGRMGRNFPNPFNPLTNLYFEVGEMTGDPNNPVCVDPGQQHRVTIRIYNVLTQLVATPDFFGVHETGPGTSSAIGKMDNLALPCGRYVAQWDGKIRGREVPSGTYFWTLIVDGRQIGMKKMFAAK